MLYKIIVSCYRYFHNSQSCYGISLSVRSLHLPIGPGAKRCLCPQDSGQDQMSLTCSVEMLANVGLLNHTVVVALLIFGQFILTTSFTKTTTTWPLYNNISVIQLFISSTHCIIN